MLNDCRNFPLDAVIILTHMTFDEFEAKLPCAITAGAPYNPRKITNIMGMQNIMTTMSQQVPWVMHTTLTISTSFCSRVYMGKSRRLRLDWECVDHMRRPNGTAAYCKLRKEYANIPFGLSIFDLECEDWGNACTKDNTAIPGTKRFTQVTDTYATVKSWTKGSFPC
ncbi:hypothetical protein HPB51_027464 [Rhipicephalus microplus]|uniref:Uncharacterized protein n=1 Tax=Rhipicephalus microplus TaxID=6941 RepID=A0A9J6D046_RHIMP|nr:hypothetical protein HPB51_027464 [Rhipicephalus microplus]